MEKEYQAQPGVPVPPPELVRQWLAEQHGVATAPGEATLHVAAQAARWGYRQAREDARRLEAPRAERLWLAATEPLDQRSTRQTHYRNTNDSSIH